MPTDLHRRVDRFKEACKQAGVKLTHQRLEIFREVASTTSHPDAETIYRRVRQRIPTISLDTVYRTLWMLTDVGLVTTMGPRHERVRFDANLTPHHHFVCVRCGLARDFESPELCELHLPDQVRGFGKVLGTHLEVRGVCSQCAANEQQPQPSAGGPDDAQGSSTLQR